MNEDQFVDQIIFAHSQSSRKHFYGFLLDIKYYIHGLTSKSYSLMKRHHPVSFSYYVKFRCFVQIKRPENYLYLFLNFFFVYDVWTVVSALSGHAFVVVPLVYPLPPQNENNGRPCICSTKWIVQKTTKDRRAAAKESTPV